MAFILPKQYTLSTSPKPTDPRVKLVARQTVAVYNFTCKSLGDAVKYEVLQSKLADAFIQGFAT
eukprot:m.375681 g.375681  ORF g.375681 m.375681 type:complete len:64 (-) comp16700_c0_seq5:4350-4541(-)